MKRCFECNMPADHEHHVVPKVKGGTKTIPVCLKCHAKIHDRKKMAGSELTKLGLKRAKERGVVLGRPRVLTDKQRNTIIQRKEGGELGIDLAFEYGVHPSLISRLK